MYRLNVTANNCIPSLFIKNKFTHFYKFITTIPQVQGEVSIPQGEAAAYPPGLKEIQKEKVQGSDEPHITDKNVFVGGKLYPRDELTNVTSTILSKTTRRLHLQPSHPISILRSLIESHFGKFQYFNTFSPIVTPAKNFDELGFPEDHPGRSTSDSYYINKDQMLRTHTSAHQLEVLKNYRADRFLISADVYRRDEIDSCHYPIFHQMEGVQVFNNANAIEETAQDIKDMQDTQDMRAKQDNESNNENKGSITSINSIETDDQITIGIDNPIQTCHSTEAANATISHLKYILSGLVKVLFKDERNLKVRFINSFFPFTSPSLEMEIFYEGKWLEVCGCGVIKQDILDKAGQPDKIGWAFGLGLERIAMVLFNIPDIRLFWSQDPRFVSQFKSDEITKFQSFSKHPSCIKDISFWTSNEREFRENDFCEIVRDVAQDLVEDVKLVCENLHSTHRYFSLRNIILYGFIITFQIDEFVNPKTKKKSLCYRINYRSMDR